MDGNWLTSFTTTIRAIRIVFVKGLAASETAGCVQISPGGKDFTALVAGVPAPFAQDEGLPLANPQDWNEEKGKVIIHPG